jgi:site-specific DNA recombinase
MRPEEEWIASAIPVPKIIEREQFMRAREQLKRNFALCQRNKKNEYLLAGRIQCSCGRRRTGEGPMHGKYLYYRCSDRVLSFPLPSACKERGINARIADKLVWQKVANLMSSPELLVKQVERWMNTKRAKTKSPFGDIAIMEKEISKLKDQEERYNKAYGAALFTIEKLKEYTGPIRERVATLESQIIKAGQEAGRINVDVLPTETETKIFAREAQKALHNLNFETRRTIVLNTIEKIIGTQQYLQVYGYIPVTNHVKYKTTDRNRGPAKRR